MPLDDRFNLAQRLVLVVALGIALRLLGWWLLEDHGFAGGWTSYTPTSASGPVYEYGDSPSRGAVAFGYVVLLLIWTAGSLVLLRRPVPAGPAE